MVENVLLDCVVKSLGQQSRPSLDDQLVDLGFDSLRFIQLVVQLEHALGLEFADDRLDYRLFERVRDVLHYLEELEVPQGRV
jgi:acyl carrier protein